MDKTRHEKYGSSINNLPFSLTVDIKRTPYNLSKEQNWHENLEIQLCTSGEGSVLLDGKEYQIEKGDIIVVNSNVLHYTYTESQLSYTCLIISTDWCKQMQINHDSLHLFPFVQNNKIVHLIKKLSDVCTNSDDFLTYAKCNELLLTILIKLAEDYAVPPNTVMSKGKYFDLVKQAITFIEKNFNRKITLDELASNLYFDKYALCKEFKRYTGHTIIEHLNKYRCIKAVDFLSAGCTVYEVANLCGFDNLSYFIKTFKKHTGKTPSKYKSSKI